MGVKEWGEGEELVNSTSDMSYLTYLWGIQEETSEKPMDQQVRNPGGKSRMDIQILESSVHK